MSHNYRKITGLSNVNRERVTEGVEIQYTNNSPPDAVFN